MRPLARWRGSGFGTAESSASVYGCSGLANSSSVVRQLDQLADVHHRHPVADVLDHAQVVGDEQVGQAELLLQVLQQVEDLRLDRDVQRRDRLVADDQLRVQRQRAGDADALPLAAAEGVRVAAHVLRAQPDELQQLGDPVLQLLPVARRR